MMSEMQPTAKKPSKLEQLQAQLARAKAELEAKRPALEAEIRAWEADRAQLRNAADGASKASRTAYSEYEGIRTTVRDTIIAQQGGLAKIYEQLRTWVASQKLDYANIHALYGRYIDREVSKDERVRTASDEHHKAERHSKKAWHAYNVKYSNAVCPARRKLDELADHVADLEKEIDRLPKRNEAARERRAAERAAQQEEADTQAALALLDSFEYKPEVK